MEKFNNILQKIAELKQQHSTKAGDALEAFYKEFDAVGRFTARRNGDADFLSREKALTAEGGRV